MAHHRPGNRGRHRLLPSSFTLALFLAGLATGLLTLAAATWLEPASAIEKDAWPGCVALQIGSMNAAVTHIHLKNVGTETVRIRFAWVDDYGGIKLPIVDLIHDIDSGTSADIPFRAPGPGAIVEITSSLTNLHASAEVHRDDGGLLESRHAFLCLGR